MSFGIFVFLGGGILKKGSAKELTDDEIHQVCRNHNSHDKLVDALRDLIESCELSESQLSAQLLERHIESATLAKSRALLAELEGDK